ncbi:hypothetical protein PCE1_002058 [Barthelona sp. PCE]
MFQVLRGKGSTCCSFDFEGYVCCNFEVDALSHSFIVSHDFMGGISKDSMFSTLLFFHYMITGYFKIAMKESVLDSIELYAEDRLNASRNFTFEDSMRELLYLEPTMFDFSDFEDNFLIIWEDLLTTLLTCYPSIKHISSSLHFSEHLFFDQMIEKKQKIEFLFTLKSYLSEEEPIFFIESLINGQQIMVIKWSKDFFLLFLFENLDSSFTLKNSFNTEIYPNFRMNILVPNTKELNILVSMFHECLFEQIDLEQTMYSIQRRLMTVQQNISNELNFDLPSTPQPKVFVRKAK